MHTILQLLFLNYKTYIFIFHWLYIYYAQFHGVPILTESSLFGHRSCDMPPFGTTAVIYQYSTCRAFCLI